MRNIAVVAPHPDDETLGCGGALLRHRADGDRLHWIVATKMTAATGYSAARRRARAKELATVRARYAFASVHELGWPTGTLESVPLAKLVAGIGAAFKKTRPDVVYLPFPGDAHSDHRIVFQAASGATKWFRYPSVRRVLAYEALSETDFGINPTEGTFRPNVFVDISRQLERKIEIMRLYAGELQQQPFPRSDEAIRALAQARGAAGGFPAAEAFMLLRERLA